MKTRLKCFTTRCKSPWLIIGLLYRDHRKGDYQRYLSEISSGDEHKVATDESFTAYKTATELAEVELPPTHPVRLGLALNLSVFYYEILQSPNKACQVAESAFSNAIRDLNTLTTSLYKDSSLIMQLLQDNLSLWKPDCSEVWWTSLPNNCDIIC